MSPMIVWAKTGIVRMRRVSPLVALLLMSMLVGCYRASIDTGAPRSTQVVENCCAAGYLVGLIGPGRLKVEQGCEHGAARLEMKRSFSNLFWSVLTLGIYTPLSYRLTCAAAGGAAPAAANPNSGVPTP